MCCRSVRFLKLEYYRLPRAVISTLPAVTDEDALDDVFQFWSPPHRRIPALAWSNLKKDLLPFLQIRYVRRRL